MLGQRIDTQAVASIQQLHDHVLACERATQDPLVDASARAALRSALDTEQRALEKLGFTTYDAFAEAVVADSHRDLGENATTGTGPHVSGSVSTADSKAVVGPCAVSADDGVRDNQNLPVNWHPAPGHSSIGTSSSPVRGRMENPVGHDVAEPANPDFEQKSDHDTEGGEGKHHHEVRLLRQNIAQLQAELIRVQEELSARGTALNELECALTTGDAARVEHFASLDAALELLEATQREFDAQQARLRALEKEVEASKGSRVQANELDGVVAELREARQHITQLESDAADAQSMAAELGELRQLLVADDVVVSKLQSADAVIAEQREQIERLSSGISAVLAATSVGYTAEEASAEATLLELASYVRRLEEAAAEAQDLRVQVSRLLAAGAELAEARDAAIQRIIELERLVAALNAERDAAAAEVDEMRSDLASVRAELQRQLARSEQLSHQVASITDELESMRSRTIRRTSLHAPAVGVLRLPFRLLNAELERQRRLMRAMRKATCHSFKRLGPL